MDRQQYFDAWAALHGGYDPRRNRLALAWMSVAHACARPLVAARFTPNAVTLLGLIVGCLAIWPASIGGRAALWVPVVVIIAALLDNLDGAVAVMTSRTSRWGFVLDSTCDRITDAAFLAVLWLLGAPAWACAVGALLTLLVEYARARSAAAGMAEIGVVTVWERPMRVAVVFWFVLGAGLYPSSSTSWVSAAACGAVALGAVAFGQILTVARRRLSQEQAEN
ncbi:MAG TPA: CDP-alcohol phosphatidyltransferase [Actinobacteria bacterium]|nr:CDP-alcohol phosphatidyltransferase [Actinomycetota bacterium]